MPRHCSLLLVLVAGLLFAGASPAEAACPRGWATLASADGVRVVRDAAGRRHAVCRTGAGRPVAFRAITGEARNGPVGARIHDVAGDRVLVATHHGRQPDLNVGLVAADLARGRAFPLLADDEERPIAPQRTHLDATGAGLFVARRGELVRFDVRGAAARIEAIDIPPRREPRPLSVTGSGARQTARYGGRTVRLADRIALLRGCFGERGVLLHQFDGLGRVGRVGNGIAACRESDQRAFVLSRRCVGSSARWRGRWVAWQCDAAPQSVGVADADAEQVLHTAPVRLFDPQIKLSDFGALAWLDGPADGPGRVLELFVPGEAGRSQAARAGYRIARVRWSGRTLIWDHQGSSTSDFRQRRLTVPAR